MATQALELSIEALRKRRGTKWHRYPDDVLGAWVADMDFTVAEPVEAAIRRVVDARRLRVRGSSRGRRARRGL